MGPPSCRALGMPDKSTLARPHAHNSGCEADGWGCGSRVLHERCEPSRQDCEVVRGHTSPTDVVGCEAKIADASNERRRLRSLRSHDDNQHSWVVTAAKPRELIRATPRAPLACEGQGGRKRDHAEAASQ